MTDRFSAQRTADDDAKKKENHRTARNLNTCPARDARQQWITLAGTRMHEFVKEFDKVRNDPKKLFPYDYMSSISYQPILAYFLFTVEILDLKGHITIIEREPLHNKPVKFVILNPEGCKGSFDIIFSMQSEESPDDGNDSIQAPSGRADGNDSIQAPSGRADGNGRATLFRYRHAVEDFEDDASERSPGEMVWFNDKRHKPLQSSSQPGAFSTPMPKFQEPRTFDDLRRTREEGFFVPAYNQVFTPRVLLGSSSSRVVRKDEHAVLKNMKATNDGRWKRRLRFYIATMKNGNPVLCLPYPDCFSEPTALHRIFKYDANFKGTGKDSRLLKPDVYYSQLRRFLTSQ